MKITLLIEINANGVFCNNPEQNEQCKGLGNSGSHEVCRIFIEPSRRSKKSDSRFARISKDVNHRRIRIQQCIDAEVKS